MANEILILRLEGPLQSWECALRSDETGVSDYPTKSGIVQLLAHAHGAVPGDPRMSAEFEDGLRFGVRVEAPGRIAREEIPLAKQVVRGSEKPSRRGRTGQQRGAKCKDGAASTRGSRDYIQDASFLVALERTEKASDDLLRRCAVALIRPARPIFLGRRSCPPTRPVFECLSKDFDDIEEALMNYPWTGEAERARTQSFVQDLIAYVEDHDPGGLLHGARCVKRLVVPMEGVLKLKKERK